LFPPLLVAAAAWLFVTQPAPLAAGGELTVVIAVGFWMLGKFPVGFPEERVEHAPGPSPEASKKWSRRELIREMRREMLFLRPPMVLAALWWLATTRVGALNHWWSAVVAYNWVSGLLGAIL